MNVHMYAFILGISEQKKHLNFTYIYIYKFNYFQSLIKKKTRLDRQKILSPKFTINIALSVKI